MTHKILLTMLILLKQEVEKTTDMLMWRLKAHWLQPYTKSCRQLRNAAKRRNQLPWGRTHGFVSQDKMISPENSHTLVA